MTVLLLWLGVLLAAQPLLAEEFVRVRISAFEGDEPLSLSSASHPDLFVLHPSIASAALTATNELAEIEDNGPATWFPVMTPESNLPPGGRIELELTPVMGMPFDPGLIAFQTEALFPGNPSSFVFAWSVDGFATPLALIDTAVTTQLAVPLQSAPSDAVVVFRWSAGDDFGENGGGQAGFSEHDLVISSTPCPETPAAGCASPGRASLSLEDDADPARRKLAWSWSRGTAARADFGDPSQGTPATLCLYDERGLVLTAPLALDPCGSKPCWKSSAKGFSYKNKSGGSSGLVSAKLKAGEGKASLTLKGTGPLLELPLPMSAATGVRAQLVNPGLEACFESVFEAPAELDEDDAFEDSLP